MNDKSHHNDTSAADFRLRAIERLASYAPPQAFDPSIIPNQGDHRLATLLAPADGSLHRRAAVLVPVVDREQGATILFTRRAAHLKDHAGQIAFPGGKMEEQETDPVETALREAEEEIGLERQFVEPIGYLDPYLSSTGYRIVPVVAVVGPTHRIVMDPNEVEATFEVPLAFLMDPQNHQKHAREWQGALRHYFAMPYRNHYIWGVTAGILRTLYEKVYGE
jgi:8-oxo-dGTP pyrophosphatase MutT (NUDIX family)